MLVNLIKLYSESSSLRQHFFITYPNFVVYCINGTLISLPTAVILAKIKASWLIAHILLCKRSKFLALSLDRTTIIKNLFSLRTSAYRSNYVEWWVLYLDLAMILSCNIIFAFAYLITHGVMILKLHICCSISFICYLNTQRESHS